ncbi:monocarboxylate transporter 3-like isoform X1 [Pagrus major]|uniref:monocarboxylate transporter 3-like isoform X1 n=1 Tax=Pagrus major TaxID=143350 RepID=UPI003CC84F09
MCPPASGPPAAKSAAPDGGWGWVVVLCSFMALLVGYGSPQSLGILYPEWLLTFREGKAMTAWVGSLVAGGGFLVGPVCSVCVVNFGARPVAVFSGVMVAGGFMLSAFAPNVSFLIFSYGIVVGVGNGLLYAAIVVIICVYFDKKRGLALGIIQTGTSVGGVLYGELQRELIELFGVDGCLLVVGALALNVVAFAGLMRPLTPSRYYLTQRDAILERAAEEQQLEKEKEEPSNQKPSANGFVIAVETEELPVRRWSLFSCSASIKMIKIKTRHYSQSVPPSALPGGPGSELRADRGRLLHVPGLPQLHRGHRGETGVGCHSRHAAGQQRPPVRTDGGSERAGSAAHPPQQVVPGPPGAVGGPGLHGRELDPDAVHHQSGGRHGETGRGSRDAHVVRRRRPHAGSSCRGLFL